MGGKLRSKYFYLICFILIVTWIAGFAGLAVYAGQRARIEDSDIIEKIEQTVIPQIKEREFSFPSFEGINDHFEEIRNEWKFLSPVNSLSFVGIAADIEVVKSSSKDIRIVASADVDVSTTEKVLIVDFKKNRINLRELNQEEFEDLRVRIEMPEKSVKNFKIELVSGDVSFEEVSVDSLLIKNVSGKTEFEKVDIKNLVIDTVSGSVNIESQSELKADIKTVSGDVRLKYLQQPLVSRYDFQSMSGEIQSKLESNPKAKNVVQVKTTSGDIEIE